MIVQFVFLRNFLGCHTSNANDGNPQPDNAVATFLSYEHSNRLTSHLPTNKKKVK